MYLILALLFETFAPPIGNEDSYSPGEQSNGGKQSNGMPIDLSFRLNSLPYPVSAINAIC